MNTSWLKRGRTLGLLFLTALLVMLPLAGCQRSGDAGNGMRKVNGQEIKLRLLARSDTPSTVRSAEMVAQYLHAVGIGAEIIAVDSATWVAKKDAKEYDIVFFRATPWGNMMHASHGTGYFDSRRTGQGVLHNLDAQDYLDACDARLNTAIADEQRTLDLQLQQMHHDYLPGLALAWVESVYPYRTGWDNWVIDHIYGGVVNSFSWFTVTQNASADDLVLRVGSTKPFKTTNKFSDYWYGVLSGITTHDSLIKLDTNMQPAPWLATSWEVSADSKQFTFTIAEGVKWHDGIPLTPEDVKFSIEYHRDKIASSAWMKEIIDNVQVDGRNVIINLVIPYGNLLTEFMTYHPIPKHIWEDVDDPDSYNGADRVIGSGPFKLDSWNETAGKFTFTANDDYFQGRPNVDRLVVDVYKNMDALVMSLSRGNIDTWWDYSGEFPYTHVSTLQGTDKIEFASATFLGVPAAIGFNLDVSPTNELAFRQAVAKSINYEQIAELVFDNYGVVPTYGFAPSTHPNFNDSIPSLEYDPDGAKALLDSLGFKAS